MAALVTTREQRRQMKRDNAKQPAILQQGTSMTRLTDNDKRFGPLTWGRSSWHPWRVVFSTGGSEDSPRRNSLSWHAFGRAFRLWMPTRLQPWRQWVATGHYAWAKSPDAGYWDVHAREWGFCLHEGHFTLYLGAQTHDSTTTRSWSCFLPWTDWRHIRKSLYDDKGRHFWTEWDSREFRPAWEATKAAETACPAVVFEFDDYDGKRIRATTRIEEREWRFGTRWCSWLSLFRKPRIRRSLDIDFSEQVGPGKGSWKGGTLGHGIEMLPGELHEQAFRRYCEQEHRAKSGRFRITFVGQVPSPRQHPSDPQSTE